MKRFLIPIAWMLLMFVMSSDLGSMSTTSRYLVPFFRFLYSDITQETLHLLMLVTRKAAHLAEYAILAGLWFLALNCGDRGKSSQPILFALLISVVYAGLDEIHHAFVASRTGSIVDVGIDSIGAVFGLLVLKGGTKLSMPFFSKKKAKYFGWWFAWGGFSTVMVLIVSKGASLAFWQILLLTLGVATASGIGGLVYHVRRG